LVFFFLLLLILVFSPSFSFGSVSSAGPNNSEHALFKNRNRSSFLPFTWQALTNKGLKGVEGLYQEVWDLEVSGRDLYVGGIIRQTGDGALTDLGHIVRYDTSTNTWHPLPNKGLDWLVYEITLSGDDLYVGGNFDVTGDGLVKDLNYIARFDTKTQTWHALPNKGLRGTVLAIAVSGDDLYVGGGFTETFDGSVKNLGNIARFNTKNQTWHALPNKGLSGFSSNNVESLVVSGDDLYIGGNFSQTSDGTYTGLGNIVRFDTKTQTWHTLPNNGLKGAQDHVVALLISNSDLYVGGFFTQTGDGTLTDLGYIARYDTKSNSWHALPNQGFDNIVRALAVYGDDLYVGGRFTQTGDGALADLGHIARFDLKAGIWHPLPNQGLINGSVNDEFVLALTFANEDLYVGGHFEQTGDGALKELGHIARFDPMVPSLKFYFPIIFNSQNSLIKLPRGINY
jgi:N-acetylneuraminic acid mutarotase